MAALAFNPLATLWGASILVWVILAICVGLLVALDIYSQRRASTSTTRSALEVLFVFLLASTFAVFLAIASTFGFSGALDFFSAYVSEWLMSLDNLFVMKFIIDSIKVPEQYQQKVLSIGIWGSIVLRCGFIVGGTTLLQHVVFVGALMGLFLLYLGYQAFRDNGEESELSEGLAYRFVTKVLHVPLTKEFLGGRLYIKKTNGKMWLTPLGLCVALLTVSGLIFAFDSIPVVLSITSNLFIALSSNVLSVMGQRSVYALFQPLKERVSRLSQGLGIVLALIGTILVISNEQFIPWVRVSLNWLLTLVHAHPALGWIHPVPVPTLVELGIIVVVISLTALVSHFAPKRTGPPASTSK